MKAEREKQGFIPIVITIKTPEEAEILWHLLNCDVDRTLREYIRQSWYHLPELSI